MKVRNINGTAHKSCNCDSWLDHWKKFCGKPAIFCSVLTCANSDIVGAHIIKSGDSKDQSTYICPLCNAHNQATGELSISDKTDLVPANVQKTCGKSGLANYLFRS